MEFREARAEEIPYLKARLAETEHEQVDLDAARVWVAIEDQKIIGVLPARMCWQLEPLVVFAECQSKMTRRRAALGLHQAAEIWLADRTRNRTGIYWAFAIIRNKLAQRWAPRLGWHRQYIGAPTFLKYFQGDTNV